MKKTNQISARQENGLQDLFARTISYLRLSLTDRCNLHCMYCRTREEEEGCFQRLPQDDLLTYEELIRVVRIAVGMGIAKVRLTGGEPLVRRDIMYFVRELAAIADLDDIRMTTNGVLLDRYAAELFAVGIRKVNISLDTLRPERFARITGVDCYQQVWQSIETTLQIGFSPVKVNMVVMRGINDDELLDFARLSLEMPLQIRFIEFMPIGRSSRWQQGTYVSTDEIMEIISRLGPLIPRHRGRADGPAKIYQLGEESPGSLGFISPISHHFCDRCNRLRLTSEGKLRSCLLHDEETDLRSVLRRGGSDEEIKETLLTAIRNKPKGHQIQERLSKGQGDCNGRMSRIGG